MEFVAVKTIDELGRVTVPTKARQALGWDEDMEIEFFTHNDAIILEAKRPAQELDTQPVYN
ncbi:MAG: AbrB/MazE/SpoVT family DNA-binding domain-containing protein [Defluviitaleaceae bacterium]|nr:AbrB/MazE/SpoVT family DNA-binding domain-containing protein [Defluviitaleaceae bacterium]